MESKETRETVRDYLNEHSSEEEVAIKFDLEKCSICGNYELEEDMEYHKWDIGCEEEQICPDCRNNE